MPLNWYSSMKKKLRKIRIIFDIENWLWKSEIGSFRLLDLEQMLIWQKFFFMKKCYFHLIKLPFDAEVDEKFLNVIYYLPSQNCLDWCIRMIQNFTRFIIITKLLVKDILAPRKYFGNLKKVLNFLHFW